jgi:hypothetical protein
MTESEREVFEADTLELDGGPYHDPQVCGKPSCQARAALALADKAVTR